jgi:hypothetical protein
MAGRGGGKRGQGTKPKAPIFPIGPRRRRLVRPPFSKRLIGRLTSNGVLALLVGTIIGAVGGDMAHDWLHPMRAVPTVAANAPATAPVAVAANPAPPQPAPPITEQAPAAGSSTEVAMAAPTNIEPIAQEPAAPASISMSEAADPATASNAPAGADREDLGSIIAALDAEQSVAPAAGPSEATAPVIAEPTPVEQPMIERPGAAMPAVAIPTPSGTPAWLAYAVPGPEPAGRAMIAIVLDDVGLNRVNAERAIELPAPITLSFMTYAENLPQQAAEARRLGHELMLHVPMEPLDAGVNAGPDVLGVDLAPEEIRRRLNWGLDRMTGYVGINNHMGSRFTADPAGMAELFAELHRRGLLFLDSRTTAATVGGAMAVRYGVPFATRNVFLDNEMSAEAVWEQLMKTEADARRAGFAIAIGHPHDGTIAALAQWLPTLRQRGFALVPISRIVERNLAARGQAVTYHAIGPVSEVPATGSSFR